MITRAGKFLNPEVRSPLGELTFLGAVFNQGSPYFLNIFRFAFNNRSTPCTEEFRAAELGARRKCARNQTTDDDTSSADKTAAIAGPRATRPDFHKCLKLIEFQLAINCGSAVIGERDA